MRFSLFYYHVNLVYLLLCHKRERETQEKHEHIDIRGPALPSLQCEVKYWDDGMMQGFTHTFVPVFFCPVALCVQR